MAAVQFFFGGGAYAKYFLNVAKIYQLRFIKQ